MRILEFHTIPLFRFVNTSSMKRINKTTLLREILPGRSTGVEISRKTACGTVLTCYSWNTPLFSK